MHLDKLLQNGVLSLKWVYVKNYEELLLENKGLGFKNTLLDSQNA